LKVLDFISEHRAGIPQFASGMLPTDSLEERLRLVMQSGNRKPVPESVKYSSMVVGTVLFLLHPIPIASGSSIPAAENLNTKTAVAAVANQQPLDGEIPPSERVELPLELRDSGIENPDSSGQIFRCHFQEPGCRPLPAAG
jgi:hypothetical protein